MEVLLEGLASRLPKQARDAIDDELNKLNLLPLRIGPVEDVALTQLQPVEIETSKVLLISIYRLQGTNPTRCNFTSTTSQKRKTEGEEERKRKRIKTSIEQLTHQFKAEMAYARKTQLEGLIEGAGGDKSWADDVIFPSLFFFLSSKFEIEVPIIST